MNNVSVSFNQNLAEVKEIPRLVGPYERELKRGKPYRARVGANESLFGPSPKAIETAKARNHLINFYGDPDHTELKQHISKHWSRPKNHIVVGEGVEGLLELFARAFISPGDTAILTRGSYSTLAYYVKSAGGSVVGCPYGEDYRVDYAALARAANLNKAKLIYVANPDNPTGTELNQTELRSLLTAMPNDCLLLLDEAYAEFSEASDLCPNAGQFPNLVRMRSFSKAYGLAGIRVGYALAAPEITDIIELVRQRYGVSKLSQEMAAAALKDQGFIDSVRALTKEAKNEYYQIVEQLKLRALPSSTNFVAIDLGSAELASATVAALDQQDVLVMQSTDPTMARFVRVTAAPSDTVDYFKNAMCVALLGETDTDALGS